MKVLIVGWWGGDHPGPNSCLVRLSRPFVNLGHQVDALSVSPTADIPSELGINKVHFGKKDLFQSSIDVAKLSDDYDLIYSWAINRYYSLFSCLRKVKKSPKVWLDINVDTFDCLSSSFDGILWKKFADFADLVTVPSVYYMDYLKKNWLFKDQHMRHLFYSVDSRLFEGDKKEAKFSITRRLQLDGQKKLTVHTGRVDNFQLEVYSNLLKNDYCNVIVMSPDLLDPSINTAVVNLERKYPKNFKALKIFLVFDEIIPFLLASDFFIVHYPNYFAGHPMKLYDYLGAGKPIITNDFPGISDLVPSRIAVKLHNPSVETYVDSVKKIVCDDGLSVELSRNSELFARENFHVNNVSLKINNLLNVYCE